jgi:hypothetical protein
MPTARPPRCREQPPPEESDIRANTNTINSNLRYGVEVLGAAGARATAFAQIVGNSMASNRLGEGCVGRDKLFPARDPLNGACFFWGM